MSQTVKFDKELVDILKNFNTINPSLYIKGGSLISTISPSKSIFAKYTSDVNFESDFGVYKLDKLISLLSFFESPDVVVDDDHLTVKSGKHTAKINFASPEILIYPKKDDIKLPEVKAELELTEEHINTIIKSFSVMDLPEIAFVADGSTISLVALDSSGASKDTYEIELGDTDKTFKAVFKIANLKLIPGNYTVSITPKVAKFVGEKVIYFIAVEEKSSEF